MTLRFNVPRTHAAGFTLLEVVIAIAILAVVLSSLYGAYASSVEATEQIENARDVEQASRLALMQVADDFKSVYHQEFEGDLESSPYRFIGGDIDSEGDASKVVEFASTAHLGFDLVFPNPIVNRVSYVLEGQPDGTKLYRLVRRERPFAEQSGGLEETSMVLVEGVVEMSLRYVDAEGQVTSEWDSSRSETGDRLPKLVRIRLQVTTAKTGNSRLYTIAAALPSWGEGLDRKQ